MFGAATRPIAGQARAHRAAQRPAPVTCFFTEARYTQYHRAYLVNYRVFTSPHISLAGALLRS